MTTITRIPANTEFDYVIHYVERYDGDFPFMQSLQSQYESKGSLSDRQWDAATRCYRNDCNRGLISFVEDVDPDSEIDLSDIAAATQPQTVIEAPTVSAVRVWSPLQQAIFDQLATSDGSLMIQAVAGSGKTTTIVEAANRIPFDQTSVFLAFNATIARELQDRLPAHVPGSTFHSACYAGYRQMAANRGITNVKVLKGSNGREKAYRILDRMIENGDVDESEVKRHASAITQLVSLAKNAGIGIFTPDTPNEWGNLIDHYDIVIEETE